MAKRVAQRVLLIGWDAADWNFIRPLMARGLMPTLSRLTDGGAWGHLATLQPMLSPMLWTSIATGKRPPRHGIHGFTEVAPDGQAIRPVNSTSRRSKALWNILTQSNLRSLVVGWYASHPAEPINGVAVSNQFSNPLPAGAVWPVEMEKELMQLCVSPAEIQADALVQFIPELRNVGDWSKIDRLGKLQSLIAQTASIHALATHLLESQSWDFAAVYYEGIDRFGHEFMQFHPPKMAAVSGAEFELYRDVMTGCYCFHDMMLDTLLRLAGEDTTVMLVSDHGYLCDHHRPADLEAAGPTQWHRPFGIAALHGPGIAKGAQLYGGSILDITPTVLSLLGLPIGFDMDGRPWVDIFDQPLKVERIESWEDVAGDAGLHPADLRHDPAESVQALRQLVDLGYVAPLSHDLEKNIRQTIDGNSLNLALSLMDGGEPVQAETILRDLSARHADERPLQLQLAVCLMAQGRHVEASTILDPLVVGEHPIPRAQLLLGVIALTKGDLDAAMSHLNHAEAIDPRLPGLQARLGAVYLRARKFELARAAFARSLEDDPCSAPCYDGLAEAALGKGQAEQAVDFALQAVALAHHFPKAHYHLGSALAGIGKTAEALEALKLATRQAPRFGDAHRMLARVYRQLGDPHRALEHDFLAANLSRTS